MKKHYQLVTLSVLAVIFFFIYSYLSISTPLVFNSPDETANYFFAQKFASEGRLWEFESLEFFADHSIFPRSIKALDGKLVPVSFLGLPLVYGLIAKILGSWIIIFLTPLFVVLSILAFYGIIRRIFTDNVAFLSSILMFALPPLWYYTTRGMFHNLLFLSFLIFAVYFSLRAFANVDVYKKIKQLETKPGIISFLASLAFLKKFSFYALAGLCLGLALMTRLSEIWWVGIICLILFFVGFGNPETRKFETRRYGIIIVIVFFLVSILPFLYQNEILYRSPFATGYQTQMQAGNNLVIADSVDISDDNVASFVIPFGIHPNNIIKNVYNYYVMFFPWFVIPAILGILFFLFKKKKTSKESFYFLTFFLITAWLLVYYGSWEFNDNIDPSKITIGTSYLRYWLPSFVMLLPFLAIFILSLGKISKNKIWKIGLPLVFCSLFFYFSYGAVFLAEGEGVLDVKQTLINYEVRGNEVFELTEDSSIIITDRSDKIFFPERLIIQQLKSENTYRLIPKLLDVVPVYYYSLSLSEEDLEFVGGQLDGVKIEEIKRWGNESLYKFDKSNL